MRYLSALAPWIVLALGLSTPTCVSADAGTAAELTEESLLVFLDDFFERELDRQQVVGAGVVVVRDGRVLTSRGYGYADREENRPVDPESTIFPVQSVSKLFAATAVMQLHEREVLNLHADIRDYLGEVSLDSAYANAVTLAQLLTHTAGFDDSYIGFIPRTPEDVLSLPDFLNRHRRKVVFEPGSVHAYSNYSSLLARQAVEGAIGTKYDSYVVEEILRPLGMEQSCVLPLPLDWIDRLATGYLPAGDELRPTRSAFPDGLVRYGTSTGTLASTVADMAPFLIAHLEKGDFRGSRILEPETVRLMHARQFAQDPRVPGVTYGFFESDAGGERGLFHFGSGFGYGTFLYLLPDHRTGFYLAHSNSASRIAEAFLTAFLARYFHHPQETIISSVEAFDTDANHFAGYYVPVRRAETTFEKLPLMLLQANFQATDAQTLANDQVLPREWIRTGRLTFERPGGDGILAFREDAEGQPTLASVWDDEVPQLLVLERVPWFNSTPTLAAQLGWFFVVFVGVVLGYPVAAFIRFRRRGSNTLGALFKSPIFWAALLNLSFLAGLTWTFASQAWLYTVSLPLVALFSLPLAGGLVTALGVHQARDRGVRSAHRVARLAELAVLVTLVLFPVFLWRFHLLGFYF